MRRLHLLLLVALLSMSAPLASASEADRVWTGFVQAENVGDLETIAGLLHPEAVYLLPGERPVFGREGVLELMGVIHERFELTTEYALEPVAAGAERHVAHGTMRMEYTPRSGGVSESIDVPCAVDMIRSGGRWLLRELLLGSTGPVEDLVPGLPAPTGAHDVGVISRILVDDGRSDPFDEAVARRVGVEIWYPAAPDADIEPRNYIGREAARALAAFLDLPSAFSGFMCRVRTNSRPEAPPAAGIFPVVIYNHGYSGFTGVHQALYEELASHGYVVASVGHARESAMFIERDGGCIPFDRDGEAHRSRLEEATLAAPEAAKDRILRAAGSDERRRAYEDLVRLSPLHQRSTRIWTDDSRFVIDRLAEMAGPGGVFAGRLDLDRIGAIGHSLGGAVAGQLVLVDERVGAGVNLDGFQFGDLVHARLEKPFMFMGAQRSWAGETTIVNDLFCDESGASCCTVILAGFEHATFTDLAVFGMASGVGEGEEGGRRAMDLQRRYILGFLDRHLRGREAAFPDAGTPDGVHLRCRDR